VLITHEHYDHCDLEAFSAYRDLSVPLFVAETVVDAARKHGFTDAPRLPSTSTRSSCAWSAGR
jgi:L-ascorbate metabolism protein UlaG (beta-lactamase superfamily)